MLQCRLFDIATWLSFIPLKHKKNLVFMLKTRLIFEWALTDSNRRPSACKADALNQLS